MLYTSVSPGLGGGLFGQTSQQQLGGLGTATSTTGGLFGQPKLGGGGLLNTSTQNTLGGGLGAGGEFIITIGSSLVTFCIAQFFSLS